LEIEVSAQTDILESRFNRLRHRWQAGLLVVLILKLTGLAAVALVIYGFVDLFFALSPAARVTVDTAILAGLVVVCAMGLTGVFRLSNRHMAGRADKLLSNRRHIALGAFELGLGKGKRHDNATKLYSYLVERSVEQAVAGIKTIPLYGHFPLPEIWRQLKILVAQLLVVSLAAAPSPLAAHTIALRIMLPHRDIPPYSRYSFAVRPTQPNILYGGDTAIGVEITGARIKSQVWFVTRYRGKTHRTACFQESSDRFAQRLEKVVSPVEFCFATGKARSQWYTVNLLLQPQIAVASVTLTPPPYSRLPARQFFVGNEDLAALRRTRVQLSVTSNRPLLDGLLTIQARDESGAEQTVTGAKTGPRTITFDWELKDPAELALTIRDVQGTPNRDPFRFTQKIVPDKPPEPVITQPAGFALATPSITIPLAGQVQDDLALRRVELIRTVVGYRDRIKPLGPNAPDPTFQFESKLDLAQLGTQPGQILEFYLEAADFNPTMMGTACSDISRVQIISEDEYAAMLRARTSTEELTARYHAAASHIARLKEALNELKEAAESGKASESQMKDRLQKVNDLIRDTADLFDRIAGDFPAYDIEKSLSAVLEELAKGLRESGRQLSQADPSSSDLAALADEMLKELGASENKVQQQVADAEELALIARVMECAGKYKMVVRRQSELVRRLQRFREEPDPAALRLLASLAERQKQVLQELNGLTKDLAERARKLPDNLRTLRSSSLEFARLVTEYEIPNFMEQAADSADNQDGKQALHFATLALEKLEELMSECCSGQFGMMLQNEGDMKFEVRKDMESTVRQLLAAILAQMGGGQDQGSGPGPVGAGMIGGSANDGYWTGGYSPMNIPVFGPERMSFPGASDRGLTGKGVGSGSGGKGRISEDNSETMSITDTTDIESQSMPIEELPEKYREALKKYFSD
jgi:hypothetical protein